MITFVYAYYDNPQMLAHQYKTWNSYPSHLRSHVNVVIVDDASPRWPAINVPQPNGVALSIYRIKEDVPWHQDGARNLGAHVACDGWLFLSDMDHELPGLSLDTLMYEMDRADSKTFFTFGRQEPDGSLTRDKRGYPKIGTNIYAMTRELYWLMGGYDEDLCGYYGTDGAVRKRLLRLAKYKHLPDCPVIRWSREHIPDASTTTLPRKGPENERNLARLWRHKRNKGRAHKITTLDFEWEQQL